MIFTNIQSAIIYLSGMFFMAFFGYLYSKHKKNYMLIIGMIPLLLIATVRSDVGTDYRNYYYMFNNHNSSSILNLLRDGDIEIGYYLINRIGGFFNSFNVTLLISGFLILVIPIFTVKDNKNINLFLFSLLYSATYIGYFNVIRQGIAVAIIFNAFYNLIFNKKISRFIILTIIASTFHMSALFILPFVLINGFKNNNFNRYLRILAILILIVVVLNSSFFIGILENIPLIGKYFRYQEEVYSNNYSFYLSLLILMMFLVFRKNFIRINPVYDLFILMAVFHLIFTYLGFEMVYVKRIASYFSIFVTALLCLIPKIFKKSESFYVNGLVLVYGVGMFILNYWVFGFSNIFPYQI